MQRSDALVLIIAVSSEWHKNANTDACSTARFVYKPTLSNLPPASHEYTSQC
jgi:hypothetical protein